MAISPEAPRQGKALGVERGPKPGTREEMAEVREQSIGKIDTRTSPFEAEQGLAGGQARNGKLANQSTPALDSSSSQRSGPKHPGYKEVIAHAKAVSAQSTTSRNASEDVDHQAGLSRSGKVAPHQGTTVERGLAKQPPKQSVEPSQFQFGRRRKSQGEAPRTRTHGGQVRKIGDQGPAPDVEGRLLGPTKVDVFHSGIGTRHPVLALPGTQNRGVIADPEHHSALVETARHSGNSIDEARLTQVG